MKSFFISAFATLLGLTAVSFQATAQSAEFWVSRAGDDAAAGTHKAPFATLERAQRAVRERGKKEGAIVWIAAGVYPVSKTLDFGAEDGGTAEAPVVFRAEKDGTAVLDAAMHLNATKFVKTTDAQTVARLAPEARGKVWQFDLAAAGVKHAKTFPVRFNDGGGLVQLFCDGEWQPLSRWPNGDKAKMAKVLDRGDDPGVPEKRPGTFVFDGSRPARWKTAAEAGQLWLAGFWRVAWDWQSVRVQALDLDKKSITLAAPIPGGIGSKYAGPNGAGTEPWRAINLVEEIDEPGEWAVDFPKQTLFFWPPRELASVKVTLADFDQPIVRMKGASHVTLRGLVLQGTLGNGIEITDGEACVVQGCTLTSIGKNGVVVKGGAKHRIESCDLHALGHGGILLGGGDRASLTPTGHVADNNHIHHYALAKKIWSPSIGVGANDAGYACGCIVTHNLIHDAPHAAILYGGNDNLFEFNEIHDFLIESDDLGGFYSNNNWTSQGNVVRHNFIHHTSHALGVYLDDGDSGDTIEGNLMFRMSAGAGLGGGHDNIFRNNIAIECSRGFSVDARGVSRHYDTDPRLLKDLASVRTNESPWRERFPTLATLLQNHPELPTGCIVERNIAVGPKEPIELRGHTAEFKFVILRDNAALALADLGFADVARLDFRMDSKAPVFQKVAGFAFIPFEKIGLYKNDLRVELPEHPSGHTASEWHRK